MAIAGFTMTTVTPTRVDFTISRPSPAAGRELAAAAAAAHLTCIAGEASEERACEATADCRVALMWRVGDMLSGTPKEAYLSGGSAISLPLSSYAPRSRLSVGVSAVVALWLCARVPIRPQNGPPRPW